jgi:Asp-tRNA(Asn)/Glu-tRNA(Gln) amidotransferase B subunit
MTDSTESNITVREFLETIAQVYDENKEEFLTTDLKPENINYIVGKMMVKSKGQINPSLALSVIKAITESKIQNNFKVNVE